MIMTMRVGLARLTPSELRSFRGQDKPRRWRYDVYNSHNQVSTFQTLPRCSVIRNPTFGRGVALPFSALLDLFPEIRSYACFVEQTKDKDWNGYTGI